MSRVFMIALLAACAHLGCVQVEPDPPVDADGEPIAVPGPFDPWLEITSISPPPGEMGLTPRLAITFNDYIEDDSFDSYAFGALRSGGVRASGDASYVMTDKTVVWSPRSALEPGLVYRFVLTSEPVSATGAPLLAPAGWPTYTASPETEPTPPPALPSASWDEVEPILETNCTECHRHEQSGLNPLTYESLVGVESTQTDLFLVRPTDAADSYLMRKLLWDYPDIEFVHQPPKWDGGAQLPREELLTIEGWIAGGARR